jgi:D-sedoheptulose 7-phosphate isomerase
MNIYDLFKANTTELNKILHDFSESDLIEFDNCASLVINALRNKKTIFWCGNGGSAAESSHLAAELIGKFKTDRPPFSSISLNADTSTLTCIANDYGYQEIYSRQLKGLGKSGDVLITLSTSGNSENINAVLKAANEMSIMTVAFLGKGGGKSKDLARHKVIINSMDTARIQELHLFLGHSLCEFVDRDFGFIKA